MFQREQNRCQKSLRDSSIAVIRGNPQGTFRHSALTGSAEFVTFLRERGITFRLVTNNATLTPSQYVDKLAAMGIEVQPDEVFTSALATGMYLKAHRGATRTALVVGETGLRTAVGDAGLRLVDEGGDWVVVGLDRTATYEKLAAAALALEGGAHFVGSNPDTSFPTERGLVPGAGALLAALRATTGLEPVVIGKPQPTMLRLAMKALDGSLEDTAMLGDRLDTDIGAAAAMDMRSILVLTGVSQRSDLESSPYRPDLVVEDLPRLMAHWTDR